MEKLIKGMVNQLVINEIISEHQREIYEYCVGALLETGTYFLIIVCIGGIIGKLLETVLFLTYFMFGRSSAGGIHAKKYATCLGLSVGTYLLAVAVECFEMAWISQKECFIFFILCSMGQILLSPVDSENRKISDEGERKRAKFRICVINLLYGVLELLLIMSGMGGWKIISVCAGVIFVGQIAEIF